MTASFLASSVIVLVVVHLIATLLGAGSITVAEWQYFRALMDGRIDAGERAHLNALFFSLRYALVLMVLADVVLSVALYALPGAPAITLTAPYWLEMVLTILLIGASWLRFHGRIPFWAGSAIAFTGWWYLAGLDLGFLPVAGFGSAFVGFIVSVALIAVLFRYARFLVRARVEHQNA